MDIKKQLTRKLIQATSDKVELNKQALKWKKSMEEAAKALGGGKRSRRKEKQGLLLNACMDRTKGENE